MDRLLRAPDLFIRGLDAVVNRCLLRLDSHFLRLFVERGKDRGRGNFMLVRAALWVVGCWCWGSLTGQQGIYRGASVSQVTIRGCGFFLGWPGVFYAFTRGGYWLRRGVSGELGGSLRALPSANVAFVILNILLLTTDFTFSVGGGVVLFTNLFFVLTNVTKFICSLGGKWRARPKRSISSGAVRG